MSEPGSNEDDLMFWQDALDEVAAGRMQNLRCPFCEKGEVSVTRDERKLRLECRACRRYIEGKMGNE